MDNDKVLFSAFEAIFSKVTKRSLNNDELERLRQEIKRLVEAIRSMSERVALAKAAKLNAAVKEAFTEVAKDMHEFQERLAKLEGDGK